MLSVVLVQRRFAPGTPPTAGRPPVIVRGPTVPLAGQPRAPARRRHQFDFFHSELCAGMVACIIVNVLGGKSSPFDFVSSPVEKPKRIRDRELVKVMALAAQRRTNGKADA